MKKLIYILMFVFPVVALTQQPWYKYSPMDYAWKYVGNDGFSQGMIGVQVSALVHLVNLMWHMRIGEIHKSNSNDV